MFVFAVVSKPATPHETSGTPNAEDTTLVLRQTNVAMRLRSYIVNGRAVNAGGLTGISFRVNRWDTPGSGGTSITPGPTAGPGGNPVNTVAADKRSAITPGTTLLSTVAACGCGASSMGGWSAADNDSKILLGYGTSDELNFNTVSGAASMLHDISAEIEE